MVYQFWNLSPNFLYNTFHFFSIQGGGLYFISLIFQTSSLKLVCPCPSSLPSPYKLPMNSPHPYSPCHVHLHALAWVLSPNTRS
jgi:hypothetical protein